MRMKRSVFVLLSVFKFIGSAVSAQDRPFNREAKQKAEALPKQMTPDESHILAHDLGSTLERRLVATSEREKSAESELNGDGIQHK